MVSFSNVNKNSARNFNRVCVGPLTFWFSYDTCVAFDDGHRRFVRENSWSTTTGKHLNWISNKSQRMPAELFKEELEKCFKRIRVS